MAKTEKGLLGACWRGKGVLELMRVLPKKCEREEEVRE